MPVKRSGGKPQNKVSVEAKNYRDESRIPIRKRPTPRFYDEESSIPDGATFTRNPK